MSTTIASSASSSTQQLATLSGKLDSLLSGALTPVEVALYNTQFSAPDTVAHSPYKAPLVGQSPPDFTLFDHTGKQVHLQELIKQGKNIVLFWFRSHTHTHARARTGSVGTQSGVATIARMLHVAH